MTIDVKKFIARQLNDHSESPSGVQQKTYYEWTEGHITDAVNLGICYLYSLLPNKFSIPQTHTTTESDCIIEFCETCYRFMGIVSVDIEGNECAKIDEVNEDVNDLGSLLTTSCEQSSNDGSIDNVSWKRIDGTDCIIKFNQALPIGTDIRYLCSAPPDDLDDLGDQRLCEYGGMIADYALWWLFRTDSESRSNLQRASLHFEGLKNFVETKLLLEFSLSEDKYNLGRRSVDD